MQHGILFDAPAVGAALPSLTWYQQAEKWCHNRERRKSLQLGQQHHWLLQPLQIYMYLESIFKEKNYCLLTMKGFL